MSKSVEIAVKLSGLELINLKLKEANYHGKKLKKTLEELKELQKNIKLISE